MHMEECQGYGDVHLKGILDVAWRAQSIVNAEGYDVVGFGGPRLCFRVGLPEAWSWCTGKPCDMEAT